MLRALLVTALLGQTIYTWTDKNGEEHFTDDPSSIPKGAKAKTMAPGEIETVRSSDEPAPVAAKPVPAAAPDAGAPKVDTCALGRKAVADAQAALDAAKQAAASPPERDCQSVLNTLGKVAYAQCMAHPADPGSGERKVAQAQRRLDDATDDLRRAKAAGCR